MLEKQTGYITPVEEWRFKTTVCHINQGEKKNLHTPACFLTCTEFILNLRPKSFQTYKYKLN